MNIVVEKKSLNGDPLENNRTDKIVRRVKIKKKIFRVPTLKSR